jgi:hypothetical protein
MSEHTLNLNTDELETVGQETTVSNVSDTPKKRGRKSKKENKFYFGEEEEKAFVDYLRSDDKKFRDKIFAEKLYHPFTKMIESIIRRYNLFTPDEDFTDTFNDTMSFLMTRLNTFDPSKNYKAYSYCGTICRNYLILKRTQYSKKIERQISYDLLFPTSESDKRTEPTNDKLISEFNNELINKTISKLQEMLLPENSHILSENEIKIGNALLEMLMNWEEIFTYMGSKKFNKACVLQYMRDYTELSTTEIREGMKRYKDLYFFTKEKLIRE